ncbi:MAG: hypothetical protein CBD02_04640 [Candidatus Pelagibacter sp. TMED142]|nr:MAG: hypothetical protein CBD02_04640 [Candidatus Pelagibacter sp. TMED142]|tara:strand:- start:79 stop:339 length:261 start_codon:yes stop_codon:yes gene_type:complete
MTTTHPKKPVYRDREKVEPGSKAAISYAVAESLRAAANNCNEDAEKYSDNGYALYAAKCHQAAALYNTAAERVEQAAYLLIEVKEL